MEVFWYGNSENQNQRVRNRRRWVGYGNEWCEVA